MTHRHILTRAALVAALFLWACFAACDCASDVHGCMEAIRLQAVAG